MLEVQRQNIAGHCQKTFENKKLVDITQQARLWLSKLGVDTSIGWAYSAPLVEIGLGWLLKLGVDKSPCPHAHRRACVGILLAKNLPWRFRLVKDAEMML